MSVYSLVRSRRKTLAIHVKPDGAIEVRAPLRLAQPEIDHFVALKSGWIENTLRRVKEKQEAASRPLPPPVYGKTEFGIIVKSLVSKWEQSLAVKTSFVGIRAMTSRWGSCTTRTRRIRLNVLLALCPHECLEYVVVHELAHLRENNHSKQFWDVVAGALPDHKFRRKALKDMQWILKDQRGNEND